MMPRIIATNWLLVALFGGLVFTGLSAAAADDRVMTRTYQNVLGTSMTLGLGGVTEEAATAAMIAAEDEVRRLDLVLSNYRDDSEITALNRNRSIDRASDDLLTVLNACEQWSSRSRQRFSCKLGSVIDLWREAEISQIEPDRPLIRKEARSVRAAEVIIRKNGRVKLEGSVRLDVSGLAKGYIIDRAYGVMHETAPSATSLKVDIGGDGRYWSAQNAWQVAISTTVRGSDSATASQVGISSGAVAASGHRDRGYQIGRKTFSHILQPRDGWPLHNAPTAAVIAPTAMDADAIATALANMPATEGADWVNRIDGAEALIMLPSGQQLASVGWRGDSQSDSTPVFSLDYEIPSFSSGNYRRPYLAIWITDNKRRVVRNLLLLGESERWARENSRWWRQVGRRDETALSGLARPTRRPGQYRVTWDGRDDFGKSLLGKKYTLHIEAAREHGEKDYVTLTIDPETPVSLKVPPKGEIGSISLSWADNRDNEELVLVVN
ncbi:MAG: DUF2271 domain-containing protein [Pseudomonadota bacterium]